MQNASYSSSYVNWVSRVRKRLKQAGHTNPPTKQNPALVAMYELGYTPEDAAMQFVDDQLEVRNGPAGLQWALNDVFYGGK